MKNRLILIVLALVMILILVPVSVAAGEQSAEPEFAWVLIETNDYENADKWAVSDDHASYIVTHGYSQTYRRLRLLRRLFDCGVSTSACQTAAHEKSTRCAGWESSVNN